jgi:hypothetical protein
MIAPIHMQIPEMQKAATLGAYVEFVYNGLTGPYKEFEFADYARAIRAIGPEHSILSSDLGQVQNPKHPDGWVSFLGGMKRQGFTDAELYQMTALNPARLLDLKIDGGTK